jgi:hypothetical protein
MEEKREEIIIKLCKRRWDRKTKNITVPRKRNKRKSLGKNIRRHVGSRYPSSRKRTGLNKVANEMMTNVDVFGTRGNRKGIREGTCGLVIAKNRKRTRHRQF